MYTLQQENERLGAIQRFLKSNYNKALTFRYKLWPKYTQTIDEKKLEKISYMLSHDIRQPLTSIMGLINTIKADNYIVDKERLKMIEEAAHDLDKKIHAIDDLIN